MMPAGEYTVDVPDFPGVLVLHGSAGNSVALLTVFSGCRPLPTTAKLIFERRDGMAYLSAVEWPDQSVRRDVAVYARGERSGRSGASLEPQSA